ncbi:MAG: aldo/keto reductase [Betaproteobacteria bacterium]
MPRIFGRCTSVGTERFRNRFRELAPDHFTLCGDRWLSSIGLGTYTANCNPLKSKQLSAAIQYLVAGGCNVIDTAPNYFDGLAERIVGEEIAALCFRNRSACREEIFVTTKVGLVPSRVVVALGTGGLKGLDAGSVLNEGLCFEPAYLRWQVARSLEHLGLQTVDCLFLHNIDVLWLTYGREECLRIFAKCVETLEELVVEGWIDAYGVSAWNGFRLAEPVLGYLSLAELCTTVQATHGPNAHFRFIQVPIGLWAPEAIVLHNQQGVRSGQRVPLLRAARNMGLAVIANGSLLQGELIDTPLLRTNHGISDLTGPLQAIQFSRSIPAVTSVLVGMNQPEHCRQNVSLFAMPKADLRLFNSPD